MLRLRWCTDVWIIENLLYIKKFIHYTSKHCKRSLCIHVGRVCDKANFLIHSSEVYLRSSLVSKSEIMFLAVMDLTPADLFAVDHNASSFFSSRSNIGKYSISDSRFPAGGVVSALLVQ